jgi:hypothetical protein
MDCTGVHLGFLAVLPIGKENQEDLSQVIVQARQLGIHSRGHFPE